MLSANPKNKPLRDRAYLDWLHDQRCIITGQYGNSGETVDPMHIGVAGKGMKSPDNEALPVLHRFHADGHNHGEISMLREAIPDDVLAAALKAYAREMYQDYLRELVPHRLRHLMS